MAEPYCFLWTRVRSSAIFFVAPVDVIAAKGNGASVTERDSEKRIANQLAAGGQTCREVGDVIGRSERAAFQAAHVQPPVGTLRAPPLPPDAQTAALFASQQPFLRRENGPLVATRGYRSLAVWPTLEERRQGNGPNCVRAIGKGATSQSTADVKRVIYLSPIQYGAVAT